ncbi:MAG: DUF6263 family protein [Bacteroidales bacterium]|nr:DUF6263 family protein [Bacteroidales bacterium]
MKKIIAFLLVLWVVIPVSVNARKRYYTPRLVLETGQTYSQSCVADMNMKTSYLGTRSTFRERVVADITFTVQRVSDTTSWLEVHYDSLAYSSWSNDGILVASSSKTDNNLCGLLKKLLNKSFTVVLSHRGVPTDVIGLKELVKWVTLTPGTTEEEKAILENFEKKMIENLFGGLYPKTSVAVSEPKMVGDFFGYADYMPTLSNVQYVLKSAGREKYDVIMAGSTDIEYIDEIGDAWAEYSIEVSDDIEQDRLTGWTLNQNLAMKNKGVMVSEGMALPLEMMMQIKVTSKDSKSTSVEN